MTFCLTYPPHTGYRLTLGDVTEACQNGMVGTEVSGDWLNRKWTQDLRKAASRFLPPMHADKNHFSPLEGSLTRHFNKW